MEGGNEPRLEQEGNGRRKAEYSEAGREMETEGVQPSQGSLNPAQDKLGWCFTAAAPSSKPCACRAVKRNTRRRYRSRAGYKSQRNSRAS